MYTDFELKSIAATVDAIAFRARRLQHQNLILSLHLAGALEPPPEPAPATPINVLSLPIERARRGPPIVFLAFAPSEARTKAARPTARDNGAAIRQRMDRNGVHRRRRIMARHECELRGGRSSGSVFPKRSTERGSRAEPRNHHRASAVLRAGGLAAKTEKRPLYGAKLSAVLFCLTKCDGQPPLPMVTGGTNVAVVGMGYRGLLEVEGVVGGGELVPAATAAGTATTAVAASSH